MPIRIEIKYKKGIDSRGDVIKKRIVALMEEGVIVRERIDFIEVIDAYSINKKFTEEEVEQIAFMLLNPVTQEKTVGSFRTEYDYAIEIGFKPGVTDNVATTVRKGIEAKLNVKFERDENVHSTQVLLIKGDISNGTAHQIGENLANPLIQNIICLSGKEFLQRGFTAYVPKVVLDSEQKVWTIPVREMPIEKLKEIAKKGIIDPVTGLHRGPLALDIDDGTPIMVIREYFTKIARDPTDAELECLAQTWSEHCKHTIFSAALDTDGYEPVPDGLFKMYIRGATEKIIKIWNETSRDNFLLSVFHDNSGIVKFDDSFAITDKVETHNTPSALDPYGGAITGIVGVDRDSIGAGLGAMPFNHHFYFCFADPKTRRELYRKKKNDKPTDKILSPRSIMEGVIAGVKDGGNKSGIPTTQGGAFFHESYCGKPLVFVGVQGLLPIQIAERKGSAKRAQSGDFVVMTGGRVGLDGIHGATFSSEAMDSGSPASAVQIGDPITQKKLSDAIIKEARDLGLFNSITDNGAGGLSCSVYEMARECGGAEIDLNKVPLKYPGMRPDQILISESQERMTLAIPPDKLKQFMEVMQKHDVCATVIGKFTDSGKCVAFFNNEKVLDIDIDFFHDGLPRRKLKTTWTKELYVYEEPNLPEVNDITENFKLMLSRLNICSKHFIFEQFDHEVQGGSIIKPMAGKGKVDSDATITRPLLDSYKGVVTTQSLYPRYGLIDTYHMSACAIDTAIRNMISVGGRMDRMALLDNFCWCSSDEPERLGQLKRAAKACYDYAVSYLTPFISGKDSMFNTFKGFDSNGKEIKIDVLPTVLISGLSIIDDVRKCQTPDAKIAGDLVYIIGVTKAELGGSEYYAMIGEMKQGRRKEYIGNTVPKINADEALRTYKCMENAIERGLIASCTSVSIGGLSIAIAKTAIGGQLGMKLDLSRVITDGSSGEVNRSDTILFSETQGRFVITVDPEKKKEFEECFKDIPFSCVGEVTDNDEFVINCKTKQIVKTTIKEMTEYYRKTLKEY